MATHIRAQISWQVESLLPRDVATINPCFRHQLGLIEGDPDWQTLANDLKNVMVAWQANQLRQLTVKLYEIKDPVSGVPNRPKATAVAAAGGFGGTSYPGEVALCLSFYGQPNGPSNRGRLYIPYFAMVTSGTQPGKRPTTTEMQKPGGLVPGFAGLGGINVDWIVWSPTKKQATKVSNWFVDDEWDTQRRRGLKPGAREAGTTGG